MNFDDFEKKLRHQSLRRVPDDWRQTILRKAHNASAAEQPAQPTLIRAGLCIWRELIQPYRYAWSAMMALWLSFWIINAETRPVDRRADKASLTPIASKQVRFLKEQRRVLAELTGPIDFSSAEPSKRPKPHSERVLAIRHC